MNIFTRYVAAYVIYNESGYSALLHVRLCSVSNTSLRAVYTCTCILFTPTDSRKN